MAGAIVVSGAASGLGAATAAELNNAGYQVAKVDLAAGDAGYACDVSKPDMVDATVAQIAADFGGIAGLVCCAGIAPSEKLVGRNGPHNAELFQKVLMINTVGTFNLMRSTVAEMRRNAPDATGQRGVVVNTASVAAYEGQIGQIAYAASKGAVAAMTLPAARELARDGIRVVAIAPGVFDTPMMQAMPDHVREAIGATVPFPAKLGDPADFASLVHHIFENPTLNGEVIRLDGALRMAAK